MLATYEACFLPPGKFWRLHSEGIRGWNGKKKILPGDPAWHNGLTCRSRRWEQLCPILLPGTSKAQRHRGEMPGASGRQRERWWGSARLSETNCPKFLSRSHHPCPWFCSRLSPQAKAWNLFHFPWPFWSFLGRRHGHNGSPKERRKSGRIWRRRR